jgi:hypothetical protein
MVSITPNSLSTREIIVDESSHSGISWAAVFAGAFIAAAMTLILVALGTGLGLQAVSAWPGEGVSATSFTLTTAIWLIIIQIIAFAVGGYITGRLRTGWVGVKTDEVYFRDTAHGFLVWAVGAVLSALLGASLFLSASSIAVNGASQVGAGAMIGAGGAAGGVAASQNTGSTDTRSDGNGYFVDMLLRTDRTDAAAAGSDQALRSETTRILTTSLANGDVAPADRTYLAQRIAQRSGISQEEAQRRVDDTVTQAKAAAAKAEQTAREAADAARKAASYFALWSVAALLAGAFSASLFATIGGRRRDEALLVD